MLSIYRKQQAANAAAAAAAQKAEYAKTYPTTAGAAKATSLSASTRRGGISPLKSKGANKSATLLSDETELTGKKKNVRQPDARRF